MRAAEEVAFLLDNDHIEADLKNHLAREFGPDSAHRRNDEAHTATA
jgi:hypothetical protein